MQPGSSVKRKFILKNELFHLAMPENQKIIAIGGSAGSFLLVRDLLKELPSDFPFPVIICMHRLRSVKTGLKEALSINSSLPVKEPGTIEKILPNQVYLAPADQHLRIVSRGRIKAIMEEPVNHSRPSIDVMMESAALSIGKDLIGILLSGANIDGADGMHKIKKAGGITLVQNPRNAEISIMPESALRIFIPDHILPDNKIIEYVVKLAEMK